MIFWGGAGGGKAFLWFVDELKTTLLSMSSRRGWVKWNLKLLLFQSPHTQHFFFLTNTAFIAIFLIFIASLLVFMQSNSITSQPLLLLISAAIKIWFTNPSLLPLQHLIFHFCRALGLLQLSTIVLTPPQPSGTGEEAPKQSLKNRYDIWARLE